MRDFGKWGGDCECAGNSDHVEIVYGIGVKKETLCEDENNHMKPMDVAKWDGWWWQKL